MSLRGVLTVCYHFPPSSASGSFRMLGFARHLPRHGWRSVVVAPPTLPWEPVDSKLADRVPAETSVYRVVYPTNRVARRLSRYGCWLPRAWRASVRAIREQKPDVLLTSGPPHEVHWLGYWLKRRYGLPWLADFRDPWFPSGRIDRGRDFASRRVDIQESWIFRAADGVIANAPNARKALRDAYPDLGAKFVTLPNGYDRETFESLAPARPASPRPPGSAVRVVHTGAIYAGRDPRPFLDAVKTLTATPPDAGGVPLNLTFYGPPPEFGSDLAREVASRGLTDRVIIAGQVPYERALRAMVGADVLLLMDSPGRMIGVPAKLYEYIGAERPVLALGEQGGDLARVLDQSGVPHQIAPPGDPGAIARALANLADESTVVDPFPRGDRHRFSREAIAGRLAGLLDRVSGRNPAVVDDLEPAHAGAWGAFMENRP